MNRPQSFLSGSANIGQLMRSPSGGSEHGLVIQDIFKPGVTNPNFEESGEEDGQQTLAERIFQALADAKIWTSRVSMRLSLEDRDRYFRQLDLLHDCDEWFDEDQPLQIESYKGFIRFMLIAGGNSKPSLALSPGGALLAVWETNGNRLTMEFKSADLAEWVASYHHNDKVYRTAGHSPLELILKNLQPYNPEQWLVIG